jgi:drug/metabolite transporter (DMT)-like permease
MAVATPNVAHATDARRHRYGLAMGATAAACYGASLAVAPLAYAHGTDPVSVLAARYLVLAAVLLPLARLRGISLALPIGAWIGTALVGIGFVATSGGLLMAVSHLPVSLATLIFYTYPTLILVTVAALEGRRPTLGELAVLALAFGGLAVALGVRFDALNPAGIGFAVLAAAATTTSFILLGRVLSGSSTAVNSTHAALVGLAVALVLLGVAGGPALPASVLGWSLLGLAVGLFACALVANFESIRHIGPVRAAMMLCLEPITAIGVAVVVLAERPLAAQWLGAALVVAAVVAASRLRSN